MAGFLSFVRYLQLKALVSFMRLIIRLLTSSPKPRPDSVLRIPSREKHRTITVHVYKPCADGAESTTPAPVLVNLYGSGLALPLHGLDDHFCRLVANAAGYVVLDVNYRLAPEHPFPAPLNDLEDTMKYVLDRPNEYQASQVSVSGFSSGGTLALAAAATIFPRGTFQSLIAFYPATDLFQDPSLRKAPLSGGKARSQFWTRIFRESYIRGMDPRDPRISPAFADTSNFPSNMLFVTAEMDASALESEELAERAKSEGHADGRDVIIRRMKGCGHGFDKKLTGDALVQARDEAYELAVNMLKNVKRESS
ncbi:carboxylesterase [Penicillium riverlandense]|uniref:carboxylesterase n=1 Tax=Penicillium riverlandense TaxID=1903569 RepID=UPI0025480F62|nr:carboxylesterase [Penicillium riverlandense]KAJ5811888.1 carboxylesterase [Penicillium riverlandense]